MRLPLLPALLVLVAACTTSELAALPGPDASMPEVAVDAGYDAPSPPDAAAEALAPLPEAGVDGGVVDPACNGSLRRAECASLNLPSAYGFDPQCMGNPWLPADGGVAFRPNGLASCIEWITPKDNVDVNCCPE